MLPSIDTTVQKSDTWFTDRDKKFLEKLKKKWYDTQKSYKILNQARAQNGLQPIQTPEETPTTFFGNVKEQLSTMPRQLYEGAKNVVTDVADLADFKIDRPEEQQGFLSKTTQDVWNRVKNMKNIQQEMGTKFSDINPMVMDRKKLRIYGQIAGAGNDIIGNAFSSAMETFIPESLRKQGSQMIWSLAQTNLGQKSQELAQSAYQKWLSFKETNPELAKDVEASGNIASFALNFVGLPAAKAGTKAWEEVLSGVRSQLDDLIKNWSKVVSGVPSKVKKTTWTAAQGLGEYGISFTSGLSRESQQAIKWTPELYTAARKGTMTREGLTGDVVSALDKRMADISDLGKWYEKIRKSNIAINKSDLVDIAKNYFKEADIQLIDLPFQDRTIIKKAAQYFREYGENMTAKNGLSLRKKLDSLVNWKSDVTPEGERIILGLRSKVDEFLGNKIPGLKELDRKYGPERQFINKVKKMILNADGEVKDNAISTIANLVGKNNVKKLERIEKLIPGIGDKVRALRAYEEIVNIGEIKTGAILRQFAGLSFGGIPGLIATNPYLVGYALEKYGLAKQAIKAMLSKGKKISPDEMADIAKAMKWVTKEEAEKVISAPSGKYLLTEGKAWVAAESTPSRLPPVDLTPTSSSGAPTIAPGAPSLSPAWAVDNLWAPTVNIVPDMPQWWAKSAWPNYTPKAKEIKKVRWFKSKVWEDGTREFTATKKWPPKTTRDGSVRDQFRTKYGDYGDELMASAQQLIEKNDVEFTTIYRSKARPKAGTPVRPFTENELMGKQSKVVAEYKKAIQDAAEELGRDPDELANEIVDNLKKWKNGKGMTEKKMEAIMNEKGSIISSIEDQARGQRTVESFPAEVEDFLASDRTGWLPLYTNEERIQAIKTISNKSDTFAEFKKNLQDLWDKKITALFSNPAKVKILQKWFSEGKLWPASKLLKSGEKTALKGEVMTNSAAHRKLIQPKMEADMVQNWFKMTEAEKAAKHMDYFDKTGSMILNMREIEALAKYHQENPNIPVNDLIDAMKANEMRKVLEKWKTRAPKTDTTPDLKRIWEVKNSLAEWELILRTWEFNGRKFSKDELEIVKRTVENDKQKLIELWVPQKRDIFWADDMKLAENAYRGTSFDPEKRAASDIKSENKFLNEVYDEYKKIAEEKGTLEAYNQYYEKFVEKYKTLQRNLWSRKARTISPMISWAGNFPVARNRKMLESVNSAVDELLEYSKKWQNLLEKIAKNKESEVLRVWDKEAVVKIGSKLDELLKKQADYKEINARLRKWEKPEKIAQDYSQEIQKDFIDYFWGGAIPRYRLTNLNAQIKNLQRKSIIAEKVQTAEIDENIIKGAKTFIDKDNNRVRIQHDQKPDSQVISDMKSLWLRWSPFNKAWQAPVTPQILRRIKEYGSK